MAQQGQVFPLAGKDRDGTRWAYRYRIGGRGSKRVQRGGFESEQAAAEALERVLEVLRREQGLVESPTLGEFVEAYLAQHEGEPETTAKLCWLLQKAVRTFGDRRLSELRSPAIAAWRMTIPAGHRFEATQALRQVLARAVSWGLLDVNPAKLGVENPQRRYTEKRPFESWEELYALAGRLGPRPKPADQDAEDQGEPPCGSLAGGRARSTRRATTRRGMPASVPIRARRPHRPAQLPQPRLETSAEGAGITPLRRVYDLRHTFATFALRAGISTFDLSRYMGTSLAMIDRHYGYLARDGREHAIRLLDTYRAAEALDVHAVDARWTLKEPTDLSTDNGKGL